MVNIKYAFSKHFLNNEVGSISLILQMWQLTLTENLPKDHKTSCRIQMYFLTSKPIHLVQYQKPQNYVIIEMKKVI